MTHGLPGLLQPWGILLLALIAPVAYTAAYRWQRADVRRPAAHLDVAAITLLGFLTGGFFWRPLTESAARMPAGGRLRFVLLPHLHLRCRADKERTIPLWNPHLFAGMPLAADVQTALFYPLNWILFLFVKVTTAPSNGFS